jgi:septum formation topological specificity factor MinE
MILVIVAKYFRVKNKVSVLKNTQMILVIVTKYFRIRVRVSVLKDTQVSFECFSIR